MTQYYPQAYQYIFKKLIALICIVLAYDRKGAKFP